jgi:hypothetical protein
MSERGQHIRRLKSHRNVVVDPSMYASRDRSSVSFSFFFFENRQ